VIKEASLYCDGGARGNPGPAGAGAVLFVQEKIVDEKGKYLGQGTNNFAEYHGLLLGLDMVFQHQVQLVHIRLDSELIVKQIQGVYKVKHPNLIPLWKQVKQKLGQLSSWDIAHVPRSENKAADAMVNQAIDQKS